MLSTMDRRGRIVIVTIALSYCLPLTNATFVKPDGNPDIELTTVSWVSFMAFFVAIIMLWHNKQLDEARCNNRWDLETSVKPACAIILSFHRGIYLGIYMQSWSKKKAIRAMMLKKLMHFSDDSRSSSEILFLYRLRSTSNWCAKRTNLISLMPFNKYAFLLYRTARTGDEIWISHGDSWYCYEGRLHSSAASNTARPGRRGGNEIQNKNADTLSTWSGR